MTARPPRSKEEFNFSFDQIDWKEYESHRPPYPDVLWDLVLQHHKKHDGTFDAALDVGGGGGVVTHTLLEHFKHVVYSDPSALYIAQAKVRFQAAVAAGRVSLAQRKFEEFSPEVDFIKGQPVDLIAAGTCIHFGNPLKVMDHFYPLLRPGGTVAAFTYGVRPIVPEDRSITEMYGAILDKCLHWINKNVMPLDEHATSSFFEARYDNVAFDPAKWTNVHRFTSLAHESAMAPWVPRGATQVRQGDEAMTTLADDAIWKEADYDFFVKYHYNLYPGLDFEWLVAEDFEELKAGMGGRRVRVLWPLALILATKR